MRFRSLDLKLGDIILAKIWCHKIIRISIFLKLSSIFSCLNFWIFSNIVIFAYKWNLWDGYFSLWKINHKNSIKFLFWTVNNHPTICTLKIATVFGSVTEFPLYIAITPKPLRCKLIDIYMACFQTRKYFSRNLSSGFTVFVYVYMAE